MTFARVIPIMLVALAGCARVVPPAAPPPAPIAPRPAPAVPPPAPPASSDWRDWPLTPGDWRATGSGTGAAATYGAGVVTVTCTAPGRVRLARSGGGTEMTVRTTTTARTLATVPRAGASIAEIAADDPLLDAIGFSRGRFVIEAAGAAPVVVPAWPEVLRVVEGCRG